MQRLISVLAGPIGGGRPGGSVAPPSQSGGNDLVDFIMYYLQSLVDAFSSVIDIFTATFSDFTDYLIDLLPFVSDEVSDIVNKVWDTIVIFDVPLGDIPILLVMLGGGLVGYIVLQSFFWILSLK